MERKNTKRVLRGVVCSDKMDKTIVVEISEKKQKPKAFTLVLILPV